MQYERCVFALLLVLVGCGGRTDVTVASIDGGCESYATPELACAAEPSCGRLFEGACTVSPVGEGIANPRYCQPIVSECDGGTCVPFEPQMCGVSNCGIEPRYVCWPRPADGP